MHTKHNHVYRGISIFEFITLVIHNSCNVLPSQFSPALELLCGDLSAASACQDAASLASCIVYLDKFGVLYLDLTAAPQRHEQRGHLGTTNYQGWLSARACMRTAWSFV